MLVRARLPVSVNLNNTMTHRYTDSPDSNWIIDVHPEDPALALVTAGSGHGFKVSCLRVYADENLD